MILVGGPINNVSDFYRRSVKTFVLLCLHHVDGSHVFNIATMALMFSPCYQDWDEINRKIIG